MSAQERQSSSNPSVKSPCDIMPDTGGEQGAGAPVEHRAPQAEESGNTSATDKIAKLSLEDMNESQDEPPYEAEEQFILRLPPEHASTIRKMLHSRSSAMKDKLKIGFSSDGRQAVVEVEGVALSAKLVDLPCVIESLKTLDKTTFYKTADISQMLVCSSSGDPDSSKRASATSTNLTKRNKGRRDKKYIWKHGITPPLKNVRKKRFRKIIKKLPDPKQNDEIGCTEFIDSPDVEKEVKRLLRADAEAVRVRWEVVTDDETKQIESQGCIPNLPIASQMSGHNSSGKDIENKNDEDEQKANELKDKDDEDDDDDDDDYEEEEEEEEENSEEYLERELQAMFLDFSLYTTSEGYNSIIMGIQKLIYCKEKRLQKIQTKVQRQKYLLTVVKNITLRNHFQGVLRQLTIEEKQKYEQIHCLQQRLKYFQKECPHPGT